MKKTNFLTVLISFFVIIVVVAGYQLMTRQSIDGEKSAETSKRTEIASETIGPESSIAKTKISPEKKKSTHLKETPSGEDALRHPDMSVRIMEIRRLRALGTYEAVILLAKFLEDQDPVVLEDAIDSLGFIGRNSDLNEVVFDILEKYASNFEFLLRGHALMAAARFDEPDRLMPLIASFTESRDETDKEYAVRAMLFAANPDYVPLIKKMLPDLNDPKILKNAFTVLAKIDSPMARELLAANVLSKDHQLQMNSIWALSRYNLPEHNGILQKAVYDMQLSNEAASVIVTSPAAADILSRPLMDAGVDTGDKLALLEIIGEKSRLAAGDTRAEIGNMLAELVKSGDPQLELEAIKALSKIGDHTNRSELLLPKLRSEDLEIREAAVATYANYCNPETYKPLLDLYWDQDSTVRRMAFNLTARFLNSSDEEVLEKAVSHPDTFISNQAKQLKEQIL